MRKAFDELIARYSEPHRKYHTLRHLEECFAKLDEIRSVAERPAEVEVALWFHDAIYEKRASDNEARSAQWAAEVMRQAGQPSERIERVSRLILATRHAAVPDSNDAKVLVDVDLSILGAAPEGFDEYERQVREEYSWVPDALFRRERRKILAEFLGRAAIFSTEPFRERYERQARANLQRSIERLEGPGTSGVAMARWYFRIAGLLLLAAGAAVWIQTGRHWLVVALLVAGGLGLLVFSFARRGDRVARAAREHIEVTTDVD